MTPFLWISLASLGALTGYSIWMTTRAIRLAYASQDQAHAAKDAQLAAQERQHLAELAMWRSSLAFDKKDREHRLLLASRERKRGALLGIANLALTITSIYRVQPYGNADLEWNEAMENLTALVDEQFASLRNVENFESAAPTPTTGPS